MNFLLYLISIAFGSDLSNLPRHVAARDRAMRLKGIRQQIEDSDQLLQQDDSKPRSRGKKITRTSIPGVEQRCPVSLDLVLSQDSSGSLTETNFDMIVHSVNEALGIFDGLYPEARFGMTIFQDIPLQPFGREDEDVCYEMELALNSDKEAVISALNSLDLAGGKDYAESQYTSLMSAALDESLVWRSDRIEDGPNANTLVAKIILTITDAIPHIIGDGIVLELEENPGTFPPQCDVHDYPSFDQISSAVNKRKIVPAFVAKRRPTGLFPDPIPVYEEFIEEVMEGMGSVQGTESFDVLTDEIIIAIDEAIGSWCEKYYRPSDCETKDIMIVRDLSSSTYGSIDNIKSFVKDYVDSAPIGSRFALVSHSDKPIEPFGYEISMDYCYWLHQDFTDAATFMDAYDESEKDHRSGGDFAENQLDAVIRGIRDVEFGAPDSDCNCAVLVTDAFYHVAGDFSSGSKYVPGTNLCKIEDYPSVQQLANELNDNNVACLVVATLEAVIPFWEKLHSDLADAGYFGNVEVTQLPDPVGRKLSSLFNSQPKLDLRYLASRN